MRQLRNIRRNAPCLIAREQVRGRAPAGLVLEIDVRQRLPVVVLHDETGVGLVDRPWRREAAGPFGQAADLCASCLIDEVDVHRYQPEQPRNVPPLSTGFAGTTPLILHSCVIK